MKKIIIIQNIILHYRKSFYNLLSKKYNVVVIHSGKVTVNEADAYAEICLPCFKLGPFCFQKKLLSTIKSIKPNYVIAMFDIRWLSTLAILLIYKPEYKFLWWGLDTGKSKTATKIKTLISKLGYPIIFYNEHTKIKMEKLGLGSSLLYVANNTFDVGSRIKSYNHPTKNKLLFVGSFDYRKRNDVLVKAFSEIVSKIPEKMTLVFVGDGIEIQRTKDLVKSLGLSKRVEFVGRVDETAKLKIYYQEAIFCVSYGQAGLSVLQSLGFGVPYITMRNAISGGEVSNIEHDRNGFFCDDDIESFKYYMLKLILNIDLSREMGAYAFEYYSNHCTVENMVEGFEKALTID